MKALIANLTAAAVLFHAAFGCCWGAAHDACARCADESSQIAAAANCLHGHHCQHEQDGDSHGHSKCPCGLECRCACVYLPATQTKVFSPELIVAAVAIDVNVASACGPHLIGSKGHSDAGPAPPLSTGRLHLLHQVFLI